MDGLSYDKTPSNVTFEWTDKKTNTKQKTNIVEYLRRVHKITLSKGQENQPCLIVNRREDYCYLPVSCCHFASLSEKIIQDRNAMTTIGDYKVCNPGDRVNEIAKFIKKISAIEEFKKNGIQVGQEFAKFKGKTLYPPKLIAAKGEATFEDYQRGRLPVSQPVQFKKETWAIVYSEKEYNNANTVSQMLEEAKQGYGIEVETPQWVEVSNPTMAAFVSAVRSNLNPKVITMAVVLIDKRESKKAIKAALDVMGIPS